MRSTEVLAPPRLLSDARRSPKAPYKAEPLYRWLHKDVQDHALDGVGAHSTAVVHRHEFDRLDSLSDAKFREAEREARARGLHHIANLIAEGLHIDHQERSQVDRIWSLFSAAADGCRRIVHAVEKLCGRAR